MMGPLRSTFICALLAVGGLGVASSPALAGSCPTGSVYTNCSPGWAIVAHTLPTTIAPGGEGMIVVDVLNVGAASSSGTVTVTDTLPAGVTAIDAGALETNAFSTGPAKVGHSLWSCTIALGREGNSVVTCTNNPETMPHLTGGGGNPNQEEGPNRDPEIGVIIKVPGTPVSALNRVSVTGGGAPTSASTEDPIEVGTSPGASRFANWDVWFSNANGMFDTQAGSHPYEATFAFDLASEESEEQFGPFPVGGQVREIDVELPPGFAGDPTVVPQCTRQQLDEYDCPKASELGIIQVTVVLGLKFHASVYNMVPPAGVADQIGFLIEGIETFINTSVRTGSDYGLTSRTPNVTERAVTDAILTLWGEPGDPTHNPYRGAVTNGVVEHGGGCGEEPTLEACQSPGMGQPFLTLPTACEGPQTASIRADTWDHPETWTEPLTVLTHDSNHVPEGFGGCEHLQFDPTISTSPDTSNADTPAGLTVEIKPPVGGLSTPEGLSTSDIKDTVVTLPEGVVINPGQAAGLTACQETPEQSGIGTENTPECPLSSRVGTVKVKTPLLEGSAEKELEGNVYVMPSSPPELHLLVAVSGDGVNLKLIGIVRLDEKTDRVTTTFGEQPAVEAKDPFLEGHLRLPELPFTDFKLSFSGGAQAALDTPTHCGTYATSSDFGPWASPFLPSLISEEASFAIASGPGGAPCPPSPLPYAPTMIAGSTTDQAGGYTDFSLLLQVPDDQQRTEWLQFKTPEGLLGMISKVPLCTNAQAEANACPAASQIGHTVVQSGPGPYPLVVPEPGQPPAPIYLTEGYEGAPYGLSIVVPLKVGPFVLPTQRVRAKIEVDQLTTQLTITTDPLPQVVAGVPTDLRTIDAVIDRPGFMFNPTGCSPRSFHGTAFGTEGAQAPIESHFQMGSCRALLFQPNFKVSTSGRTSRADGASLGVKIVYPTGELGANQASSQSNIEKVKVELPKRLPSRLTTLQKACTAAQFNSNPAGCPAASVVGHATAVTPVLPVPLSGPAYFVSNGGEAFPNLIIVLQGYGVTVHLVGDTFIDKAGITSSTFKAVPDVPIASFELNLPEGPFSALAANGNLCKGELLMPTEFVGQNGAELHKNTKIEVQGCGKSKKAKRKQSKRKPRRKDRAKRGSKGGATRGRGRGR
jgi:hypothetical protein